VGDGLQGVVKGAGKGAVKGVFHAHRPQGGLLQKGRINKALMCCAPSHRVLSIFRQAQCQFLKTLK